MVISHRVLRNSFTKHRLEHASTGHEDHVYCQVVYLKDLGFVAALSRSVLGS